MKNLELVTPYKKFLFYKDNVFVYSNENVENKLIPIQEECITDILNEPQNCTMKMNDRPGIEQITENIIITKNLNTTKVYQNCNDQNIVIKRHNIIKFLNCKITLGDKIFTNKENFVQNNIILPNILKNISYNEIHNLTLKSIHVQNIENLNHIKLLSLEHNKTSWTSLITDVIIIFIILIVVVIFIYFKVHKKKTSIKVNINSMREDTHLRDGGVINQTTPDKKNETTTTNRDKFETRESIF